MSARLALFAGLFLAFGLLCLPPTKGLAQDMSFETLKFEGEEAPPPMPEALSPARPPDLKSVKPRAQQNPGQISISAPDEIRLTPDQSQVLTLPRDAASVIVSNPAHANVFLDLPRTLIITPRAEGVSNFKALDYNGQIIVEKQIIVSGRNDHYMRIRRNCTKGTQCEETQVFYCPNGCYQVATESLANTTGSKDVAGAGVDAPGGNGGSNSSSGGDAATDATDTDEPGAAPVQESGEE